MFLNGDKNRYLKLFEQAWEHLGEDDFQPKLPEEDETPEVAPQRPLHEEEGKTMTDPKTEDETFNCVNLSASQEFDQAVLKAFPITASPGKHKISEFGVPGFETSKRAKVSILDQPVVVEAGATQVPNNGAGGSHPMTGDPTEKVALEVKKAEIPNDTPIQVYVCEGYGKPYMVQCKGSDTVGNLAQAIAKVSCEHPGPAVDIFGNQIKAEQCLTHEQVIRFVAATHSSPTETISVGVEIHPCKDWHDMVPGERLPNNRKDILWHQEARVEQMEMAFYISVLEGEFPGRTITGIAVSDEPDDLIQFGYHINNVVSLLVKNPSQGVATYVWYKNHWTPIFCECKEGQLQMATIPSFVAFLENICSLMQAQPPVKIIETSMSMVAENDCGFQTIAWLQSKLMGVEEIVPYQIQQASQWRMVYYSTEDFHKHDHTQMRFGGHEGLHQLLVQHGVADSRVTECANQLLEALGKSTIDQILKSPKPWADLKSRTNMLKPPIKIVNANELQEMIRKRAQSGKPVGTKANKSRKHVEIPLVLKANQLSIPHAVFKQEDGTELSQLHAEQVQGKSMGIMLLNIEEALPFLSLTSPVSNEGVGLLILDHTDSRLPECHEIVRIPTTCNATGEPLLITAALLQLGSKRGFS